MRVAAPFFALAFGGALILIAGAISFVAGLRVISVNKATCFPGQSAYGSLSPYSLAIAVALVDSG